MRGGIETVRRDDGAQRARRWFWALVAVAVAGTGSLSSALTARPSPLTGLWFAASSVLTTAAVLLLIRLMAALVRPGRGVRGAESSHKARVTPSTLVVTRVPPQRDGR